MKTREEIEAMSHEERRIKTAELCGWREIKLGGMKIGGFSSMEEEKLIHGPCGRWRSTASFYTLPDYLNSANSMHEAIEIMNYENASEFWAAICELHGYNPKMTLQFADNVRLLMALPVALNTAFLMTLL